MRSTPEYPQADLLAAAPEEIKGTIASIPNKSRKVLVPCEVINAVRGNEFRIGPEEALCGLEEVSGLSAFRFSTQQLANRALSRIGAEEQEEQEEQ